jgi:hypothetical protein
VLLRANLELSGFESSLVNKSSGKVGLETVCAFFLVIPLLVSASRETDFFSPGWQLGSRLESFPSLSDAKNSSLDPSDTCRVRRSRVWPSAGKSHLFRHSGSAWHSVVRESKSHPTVSQILAERSTNFDETSHHYPPTIYNNDRKLRMPHR